VIAVLSSSPPRVMVAAISGATSGIGRATAEILVQAGFQVIAVGRRPDRLAELEAALGQGRALVHSFAADVTAPGVVRELFAFSEERLGVHPDVFILCAGRGLPGSLLTSDESKWDQLIQVNQLAAMRQLRDCAELFRSRAATAGAPVPGVRDIVVLGSTVGRQLSPGNPVYGATKFALHSLVESLRQEVCSAGIRVTLIEPGFVRTEFQQTAAYDMERFDALEEEVGPFLQAHDVARAIEFVIRQPPHVHIDDLRIRPTRQRA